MTNSKTGQASYTNRTPTVLTDQGTIQPRYDMADADFRMRRYSYMIFIPLSIIISALAIAVVLVLGVQSIEDSITAARDEILQAQATTRTTVLSTPTTATTTTVTAQTTGSTSIGNAPYLGNRDTATVAIVEFSDYECPYCIQFAQQVEGQILSTYIESGQAIYAFRNNIAVPSHNPVAKQEAMAALCVQELAGNEAYFTYHDQIFAGTPGNGQGQKAMLYQKAADLGLDTESFATCLESEKYASAVDADIAAAHAAGLSGTPGFVVGVLQDDGSVTGDLIRGALPFAAFQASIEKKL